MRNVPYYRTYAGKEPYLFLQFDNADMKAASAIVNNLIDRQFRTCYCAQDDKRIPDRDWLAERILFAELTVFLISAASLGSLAFRKCLNFAQSRNKKIFCIYLDNEKLDYGFDMQLANVPGAKLSSYDSAAALCNDIVKNGLFLQDMRSENVKVPIRNNRVKAIAMTSIIAILAISIVTAVVISVYRVQYENSIAGQLEKLTRAEYLDISGENASLLAMLKGKSITTLVVRNMGLTDISALASVDCEVLDISGNPLVQSLVPLPASGSCSLKSFSIRRDLFFPFQARKMGPWYLQEITITAKPEFMWRNIAMCCLPFGMAPRRREVAEVRQRQFNWHWKPVVTSCTS